MDRFIIKSSLSLSLFCEARLVDSHVSHVNFKGFPYLPGVCLLGPTFNTHTCPGGWTQPFFLSLLQTNPSIVGLHPHIAHCTQFPTAGAQVASQCLLFDVQLTSETSIPTFVTTGPGLVVHEIAFGMKMYWLWEVRIKVSAVKVWNS